MYLPDREFSKLVSIMSIKSILVKDIKDKKKRKEAEKIYMKSVEIQHGKELMKKWKKVLKLWSNKKAQEKLGKIMEDIYKIPGWGDAAKEAVAQGNMRAKGRKIKS